MWKAGSTLALGDKYALNPIRVSGSNCDGDPIGIDVEMPCVL